MTTENHLSDAIERNIRLAMNPSGSPADVRERNRAAGFLVVQGKPAYRILLDLLKDRAEGFEAGERFFKVAARPRAVPGIEQRAREVVVGLRGVPMFLA